jgi:hypothetical protein
VWLKKLESRELSQVAQIFINLEYFQAACSDFEQMLTSKRCVHLHDAWRMWLDFSSTDANVIDTCCRSTSDKTKVVLQATSLFKETRKSAETRISELVKSKIDDILELAEYDW